MRNFIFFISAALLLISCAKEQGGNFYKVVTDLRGIYKPVEVRSEEPVDINGDGTESTDLLTEYYDLHTSNLELRVNAEERLMLYQLFWQEPVFSKPDGGEVYPAAYSKDFETDYVNVPVTGTYRVDKSFKTITFTPYNAQEATPSLIEIKGNGFVEVSMTRKIMTTQGWKDLKTKALYKRFYNSH